MSTPDILPDSRLRDAGTGKGLVNRGAKGMWRPVFCANCGKSQGLVPDAPGVVREAFVLCDGCYAAHGVPAGVMVMKEDVFMAKARAAQEEAYGRQLTAQELVAALDDPSSLMSKLAREWQALPSHPSPTP